MKLKLAILLVLIASAWGQVVPGSGGVGGTITGQIQTATGGSITNGTLTFSLSQPAVVSNTASIATQQVACYTSASGNIVGVPDPGVLPMVSANVSSGTLPAGTYYVKIYYIGPNGNSVSSPELVFALASTGTIIVNAPSLQPMSATGYGVAISTTSGTETIQGTVTGWGQYQQATPLTSGSTAPTVNTSSCNIYFSDQLIPTGTYYSVNLVNKNGSQIAGFPQTWCTYGGAGGTINVSQGSPTGNCNTNGVFYPTPIMANPANGAAQSINGSLSISGLFGSAAVNSVLNPLLYVGGDIGAQINAAAATCGSAQQCHILIPSIPQLTITTPIVFVANETLECTRQNTVNPDTSGDTAANLKYNGSGVAITMPTYGGRLIGCDLLLGASATKGVWMGGTTVGTLAYSNIIDDASIRGGGAGTTLVHISCTGSGSACEDNHVRDSRLSDFIGIGMAVDHANDTFATNDTVYAKAGNATSTSFLIDSAAGGVMINNFVGGQSGLHGFVERYTLGGAFPTFAFINNFQCDLSSSDCFLFDSTLSSANVDVTCNNCWAAGAGGAGVHISGGSGIHFGAGGLIRANAHDGVLIDGGSVVGVKIENSLISGNNQANAGFSGISIANHPTRVTIEGNQIGNFPEAGGFQQYAIKTNSDVDGLIFSGNDCSSNVVGCANFSGVVTTKLTYCGNINIVAGVTNEPCYLPGPLTTNHNVLDDGSGNLSTTGNIVAAGVLSGLAPLTITTGASASLGGTYTTGYTFNQNATAATAVTYTLPVAAAGKQYCVKNSYNGSAANTGVLTIQVSGTGQSIVFNGTAGASNGNLVSNGAAGDAACVVGISATRWEAYAQVGIWTVH